MQRFGVRRSRLRSVKKRFFNTSRQLKSTIRFDNLYSNLPDDVAQECYKKKGVYPISFSWPGEWAEPGIKRQLLSSVVPGTPYSFTDFASYLNQYEDSAFAITFKKGGWDCFRHLEILRSACIPLMPDAREIPDFTMVHYPKELLASVLEQEAVVNDGHIIIPEVALEKVREQLASVQMANYMLRCVAYEGGPVLFVDENLPQEADYLSVLTLIGLKQSLGQDLHVMHPVPYIYENYAGETRNLYGRGFGYSRVLPDALKSKNERSEKRLAEPDQIFNPLFLSNYSKVIVGNLSKSMNLVQELEKSHEAEKCIYLRGDDRAPGRAEYALFKRWRGIVFSREIY